ncbi:MAG: mercury resistance system periplasmic binding protein MerP [Gammaproteobacteria bacterium]|nr:mercury resistance system periplasmic binding protein MerP [Gammaproteobacteria bacterium]
MLKRMALPFFLLLSLLASINAVYAAEPETVVLDIPNMTCNFCPITIRKALNKVDGVIKAEASFETKTATVSFDPDKTNVEELIKATTNAGYPATIKK